MKDHAEQLMLEQSGVTGDVSYIQYQQLEESQVLDADGLYYSPALEEQLQYLASKSKGTVHVSFARNDFLQIAYYRDAAFSEPIETENCWLNPGDEIFAAAPNRTKAANKFYEFSEIRVREVDENGKILSQLATVQNLPGAVYRIPEDFTGTDISIIPIGTYRSRTIHLSAVSVRPDGTESMLENGFWQVNGVQHGNGVMELDPMGSYRIVYDYRNYRENWYYDGSEPDSYWENDNEATITFNLEPTADDNLEFKVKLHPYGSMTIMNGVGYQNVWDSLIDSAANILMNKNIIEMQNMITLLQVNGISVGNNFSDEEVNVSKIKAGDEILLRVPANLKVIAENLELPTSTLQENEREYRFAIPDMENMDFRLMVNNRNHDADGIFHETFLENGTLSVYTTSDIQYREGSELPAYDETVKVVIVPDADYCIYGTHVKNNVYQAEMKYADYLANFNSILRNHPIKPGIMVTLDTDDDLGTCAFWTGTHMLQGDVMLREGQDLQFDYILNENAGYEIILTPEEKAQVTDVWSPYVGSRQIPVTDDLQGKTLRCRDYVTLQEKVITDDIANID